MIDNNDKIEILVRAYENALNFFEMDKEVLSKIIGSISIFDIDLAFELWNKIFTKKLIIQQDTLFMEYLFSLTSNNKYYQNTFAEMILDQLRFTKVKRDTFYDDTSLEYRELSPELYEFFLNMGKKYLSGFQKSRFDTNCIYKFEITKLAASGDIFGKCHSR